MSAEIIVQKQILDYLRLMGIFAWRNNTRTVRVGGRLLNFGKKGSSDILGIIKPQGRTLAIEVKAPGEKPSDEQIAFLRAVRDAGGLSMIVESLEEVRKALFPITKKG